MLGPSHVRSARRRETVLTDALRMNVQLPVTSIAAVYTARFGEPPPLAPEFRDPVWLLRELEALQRRHDANSGSARRLLDAVGVPYPNRFSYRGGGEGVLKLLGAFVATGTSLQVPGTYVEHVPAAPGSGLSDPNAAAFGRDLWVSQTPKHVQKEALKVEATGDLNSPLVPALWRDSSATSRARHHWAGPMSWPRGPSTSWLGSLWPQVPWRSERVAAAGLGVRVPTERCRQPRTNTDTCLAGAAARVEVPRLQRAGPPCSGRRLRPPAGSIHPDWH